MHKLRQFVSLCLIVAPLCLAAGCASLVQPKLSGKIENHVYMAPERNFSCPVPMPAGEGRISDSIDKNKAGGVGGTIRFMSWFSFHRIDYTRHSFPQQSLRDEWNEMLNTQLDLARKIPSPAYVLHTDSTNDHLFAVIVAPEGDLGGRDGYGKHLDLCRAVRIFKQGAYVYAVSIGEPGSSDRADDKSSQRLERLRQKVNAFAASIKFE